MMLTLFMCLLVWIPRNPGLYFRMLEDFTMSKMCHCYKTLKWQYMSCLIGITLGWCYVKPWAGKCSLVCLLQKIKKAVQCESCDSWFHAKCIEMVSEENIELDYSICWECMKYLFLQCVSSNIGRENSLHVTNKTWAALLIV